MILFKSNLDKLDELQINVRREAFKLPWEIVKPKNIKSSAVNKIDELSPPDNKINEYELETKGSSNFSSEKEIMEMEIHNDHEDLFWLNPELATFRGTAHFGV